MIHIIKKDGAKHAVWMLTEKSKLRQTGKELIDRLEQSTIAEDTGEEEILR